jgi:hypothetical protein
MIETKKKMRMRSCAELVNSMIPIRGSRLSKYIEVTKEANNTNTSDIPKMYLYSGIFFKICPLKENNRNSLITTIDFC